MCERCIWGGFGDWIEWGSWTERWKVRDRQIFWVLGEIKIKDTKHSTSQRYCLKGRESLKGREKQRKGSFFERQVPKGGSQSRWKDALTTTPLLLFSSSPLLLFSSSPSSSSPPLLPSPPSGHLLDTRHRSLLITQPSPVFVLPVWAVLIKQRHLWACFLKGSSFVHRKCHVSNWHPGVRRHCTAIMPWQI